MKTRILGVLAVFSQIVVCVWPILVFYPVLVPWHYIVWIVISLVLIEFWSRWTPRERRP